MNYDELKIYERDKSRLCWIHSNKFITPPLFGMKYSKGEDGTGYIHGLERLKKAGALHSEKPRYHGPGVYYLTGRALRILSKKGLLLVRKPLPVKISWTTQEHDRRVIAIRASIEADETLHKIFWTSDFEMRSGITPEIKAEFVKGELDQVKWRYNKQGKKPLLKRVPDGYFEATVEGTRLTFILEYVHKEYRGTRFDEVIHELGRDFPKAYRMIVFKDNESAIRNIKVLKRKVKLKDLWYISDYERILKKPFKEAWFHLTEKLEE